MSDGSVQSGDCSGMTLTPEFAQAALGGRSLPTDKEEMKSAIARLLFGLMNQDMDQEGDPGAGSSGERVFVEPTSEKSTLEKEAISMEVTVDDECGTEPAAAINRKTQKKSGRKGKKNRGRR